MRVAIVGGGILGLSCARAALAASPGAEVVVLDKEPQVARHQTGHNSGVVHAGLYYKPGSLKARLCRRGVELLREYCTSRRLPYEECGKVLVATNPLELARLEGILERSLANGVPGVRLIDPGELRAIEPHVNGIGGLHSPTSAITDYGAVARALADELAEGGVELRLGSPVRAVLDHRSRPELELGGGERLVADRVLVCAGLQSDRLAEASGRPSDPRIVPFRGEYWALREERRDLVRGLIYPVPDPSLPFLGVHLTRTVEGSVLVGPNAVLATAREGYRRGAVEPAEVARTLGYRGMRRLARRHWRVALAEVRRSASRAAFVADARRYVPELSVDDVEPARAGVRAQAMNARGELLDDFALDRGRSVLWVRNAPSPGATSALAIGEELVERSGLA